METPAKVGNLFVKMLSAGIYPNFKKEDIVAIVQGLYDSKETETANAICNLYSLKGLNYLEETFENYNPRAK